MPRILARRATRLSPWVTLVEKDVELHDGAAPATYHALRQADYVGVLARTPSGRFALVRQYRPAVEEMTWELVGGLLEPGESPEDTARRELLEEAGVVARRVVPLGSHWAEVGRLENRQHAFFAETEEPEPGFVAEAGLSVRFVTWEELLAMVRAGELAHPLHLAIILLHELQGR